MKALPLICLFSLVLFYDSCDPFESVTEEKLPPITQEGKNTFGCLVNGKIWIPKGKVASTSNLDASYDPSYRGGLFDVDAYRTTDSEDSNIYLYMSGVTTSGSYDLCCLEIGSVLFDYSLNCYFDRDASIYRAGELVITKFDLTKRIVSGTFGFKAYKPGCDTVKVTDGRFDMKF
jgi:hypothetical protein